MRGPLPKGDPSAAGEPDPGTPVFGSPAELAQYVGEMAESLGRLAREADLAMLAHLLDMVRLEAAQSAPERGRPPRA